MTLRCSRCKKQKQTSQFYISKRAKRGYQTKCIPCQKESQLVWEEKNKNRRMVISARSRSQKRGIPFDLTPEDVTIPEVCPCCGGDMNQPHLDRIVPELGYTAKNVIVLCFACNRRKQDSTPEQLYQIADLVYRLRRERGLEDGGT